MKVTYQALLVLHSFLCARSPKCGAEIARELKIAAGTIYPMLARLKDHGWIEHVASLPAPDQPTSHFYRITLAGREEFLKMLVALTIPDGLWRIDPPSWHDPVEEDSDGAGRH